MSFDDESPWPRRLLHIPSMTSHVWSPGDKYGGKSKPRYVAVSYTWGRWQISDDINPGLQAIPIHGVDWKVPRVRSDHFSPLELEHVIKTIPTLVMKYTMCAEVEYLWLDIACINQTNDSPEKFAEIGRQAKIFKGAAEVFIWMTSYNYPDISNIGRQFEKTLVYLFESDQEDTYEAKCFAETVDFITKDPWFSSLWTLQEAFLRQDAILLTRDAYPWHDLESQETPVRLKDLVGIFETIHSVHLDPSYSWGVGKQFDINGSLERSGIIGLLLQVPTVLLAVAQQRQVGEKNIHDRVYGIMQVFGFRLGKCRPGVSLSRVFSISDLEDELGQELLAKYPLISQLFIHKKAPEPGKAWRIGKNSHLAARLPSGLYISIRLQLDKSDKLLHRSKLTCAVSRTNSLFGQFDGPTCNLSVLNEVWVRTTGCTPETVFVDLDYRPLQPSCPTPVEAPLLLTSVAVEHPAAIILFLGDIQDSLGYFYYTGLILVPAALDAMGNSSQHWYRLGVCCWRTVYYEFMDSDLALLTGQCSEWKSLVGTYG
ncbi:hypothetical protein F4680DRAFT_435469 [Xylaria scruposa]|nr:hypothetical protein F4680DRAFT_435469 [Xylaria scruposa]